MTLQYIQEERDDACIDQIGEHRTDDRNDEEGLDGIAVFITHGTHVGHGIGGGSKSEATHTGTEYGCIVVATQQGEGDEIGKDCHHHHLREQDHDQRKGQTRQFPESQGDHRHTEEQRQADIADADDPLHIKMFIRDDVTHNGGKDQSTKIGGERDARLGQQPTHQRTCPHHQKPSHTAGTPVRSY